MIDHVITSARFDGPEYVERFDHARLTGQLLRVYAVMRDGRWRTLDDLARSSGAPESSASAQLRHLRKQRFGSHLVEKRPRGDRSAGLWEYRLAPPRQPCQLTLM